MQIKQRFCISGCGYLHDVVETQGKIIVRIKMLTQYDRPFEGDDVWLDCEITDAQHTVQLKILDKAARAHQSVIITLQAEYRNFGYVHTGLTKQDPNHLVLLHTKLLSLGNCYIDSRLVVFNNVRPLTPHENVIALQQKHYTTMKLSHDAIKYHA